MKTAAFFQRLNYVLRLDTPGPDLSEIHVKGRGGRLPVIPRDLIPLGACASPRRNGKADHGSRGCLAPRLCLGGAGGLTFGRRAVATGGAAAWLARFWRRRGFFGRRAAHGRAQAGQKPHTRALAGFPGCGAPSFRAGSWGLFGPEPGLFPGCTAQKPGGAGAKRGDRAPFGGGYGGRWGQKSPFLPQKGRATGLCWGETGGESWRGV